VPVRSEGGAEFVRSSIFLSGHGVLEPLHWLLIRALLLLHNHPSIKFSFKEQKVKNHVDPHFLYFLNKKEVCRIKYFPYLDTEMTKVFSYIFYSSFITMCLFLIKYWFLVL
jgi:hypothetical protein